MGKINLLEETIKYLKAAGYKGDDVLWVGDDYVYFTWEKFTEIANIKYDSGYGGNEIEGSLMIVGEDWWMTRGEYDGSEWWDLHKMPEKPLCNITPHTILTSFSLDADSIFFASHFIKYGFFVST